MKFIHISDIHLVSEDGPLNGSVPSDRLNKCIEDITKWHGDAKFCVISGDLSEFAEKGAYQSLKKKLLEFQIPCFLMIGNHDDRIYFNRFLPIIHAMKINLCNHHSKLMREYSYF